MKLKLFFFFSSIVWFISTGLYAQITPKVWGVNGHPLTQEAYLDNWDQQMTLLNALQAKYYRIDLSVNENGIVEQANFLKLVTLSRSNKIQLLPVMVFDLEKVNSLPAEAYKAGYAIGKGFENRYHTYFNTYEIGNELDNLLIIPNYEGARTVDYNDVNKIEKCMAYLKGITDAIKSQGRKNSIIINMNFVHYGFISLLNSHNVKFDIIGLHWYSDMGDLTNVAGNRGNILKTLTDKFKKPIWITEFNVRNGTLNKSIDANYLNRNLNVIKNTGNVKGCFLYELLDEPAFERNPNLPNKQHTESHYGLIDKIKSKKSIFYQYNKIITAKK